MTHIKSLTLCLIICLCSTIIPCHAAPQGRLIITGRVILEGKNAPPRLTVRLYFPKRDNKPPVVTYTGSSGVFRFTDLNAGRYLLEVYQGDQMVYQKVIGLSEGQRQASIVINLKVGAAGE